jgi:Dolichyl-phosphate-mannose-protein mannosyltransferase
MGLAAGSNIQESRPHGNVAMTVSWSIVLAIVVFSLNLPWSPIFTDLGSDSGLFAYVGGAILHGQLPYRDVWEQKPPVGFYLNALAVILFGRNPWAIWWFNLIWVALSTIAAFLIAKKMMGILPGAIAGSVFALGVMSPSIFQGGNLMEIYALLPQAGVIACAYFFFATQRNRWAFLGGLASGIAFMTKQTSIALGASFFLAMILVALHLREIRDLWTRLAGFIAGFLIPLGIAMACWSAAGALGDLMDGIFLHSLVYVGARVSIIKGLGIALLVAFPQLGISKLYCIAALSFIPYLLENYRWYATKLFPRQTGESARTGGRISPVELTMLVVYVALPFEIGFAALGGRNFGHYYLALVPSIATVIGYIFWKISISLRSVRFEIKSKIIWNAIGMAVLGFAALVWMGAALVEEAPKVEHLATIPRLFDSPHKLNDLENYVIQNTTRDDPVLVWHIHVGINFITDRRPPQRVLFPANLFSAPETSRSGLSEFLIELEKNPPRLILVQEVSSIGLPFVNVPVEQMCTDQKCMLEFAEALKRPSIYADLQELRQYFIEHYTFDRQIDDWLIYRWSQ